MKKFIFLLHFLLFINLQAQKLIQSINIDSLYSITNPKEIFQIKDEKSGNVCLFLKQSDYIDAILLNEQGEIQNHLGLPISFDLSKFRITGTFFDGANYNILFKKKFIMKRYKLNFNTRNISHEKMEFAKEKRTQLSCFNHNNKLYTLSIYNKTSTLELKVFNQSSSYEAHIIELDDKLFEKYNQKESRIHSLYGGLYKAEELNILHMPLDVPPSLVQASRKAKLFTEGNYLKLSLDIFENSTGLVSINLEDFSSNVAFYTHDFKSKSYSYPLSNSFYMDNYLYLLNVDHKKMQVQIINTENGELTNSFFASSKDSTIQWKNTPFSQRRKTPGFFQSTVSTDKTLNKTKQILRKMSMSEPIIMIEKVPNSNQKIMSIGGFQVIENGNWALLAFAGLQAGTSVGNVNITLSIDPNAFAYKSGTASKIVNFKTLLDTDSKHKEGPVRKNIHYSIEDFMEDKRKKETVSIFSLKDKTYLLHYDPKITSINMVQF